MKKKLLMSLTALSLLGVTNMLSADRDGSYYRGENVDTCAPIPAAPCYSPSEPDCVYCLGPIRVAGNPAVRPKTCDGDVIVTLAGFYWNAHQDGMEYAISNEVINPLSGSPTPAQILVNQRRLNNLTNARYLDPHFKWNFGFKAGLGYGSNNDGWDVNVLWTWYKGTARTTVEADVDSNSTLIPLWSTFSSVFGGPDFASGVDTHWRLDLNIVDLELGREFWNSRYLTLRPHVGLRIAFLDQKYKIAYDGGSWTGIGPVGNGSGQFAFNNEIDIKNKFKGVGIRAGLDSNWNFGRGFGLYGNLAASIVYGRFQVEHNENNRVAISPNQKIHVLDSYDSFRASRGMLDLALGFQWQTMFSQCRYGFTAMVGWEHHLFFNQNQMYRVDRIGDTAPAGLFIPTTGTNNTGENVIVQSRGDLSTQGWTLTLRFEF